MSASTHKNLAEALAAFQSEAPKLHKVATANAGSYSYRYIDLADIVEEIKALMGKHGLSFSSFPCIGPDNRPALRYKLSHTSGDCESEVMSLMVAKPDAQAHGSAITYARRYALTAVLNLVADEDDDAAAATRASQRAQRANGAPQTTAQPAQRSERAASGPQKGMINALCSKTGLTDDEQKAIFQWTGGTAVLDRMTAKVASQLIDSLKEDGSGAQDILAEISAESEQGNERARVIVQRYFQVTPHA